MELLLIIIIILLAMIAGIKKVAGCLVVLVMFVILIMGIVWCLNKSEIVMAFIVTLPITVPAALVINEGLKKLNDEDRIN